MLKNILSAAPQVSLRGHITVSIVEKIRKHLKSPTVAVKYTWQYIGWMHCIYIKCNKICKICAVDENECHDDIF